jgi:hypothetical protein
LGVVLFFLVRRGMARPKPKKKAKTPTGGEAPKP